MGAISILPPLVQRQIAAGEVIERPLSVVKELVENAIDSGATDIQVDLEDGGATLVRVSDNGCGMDAEDAALSIIRHATSKIHDAEDLFAIATYGFRGEALASISSVSDFRLSTKQADAHIGHTITTLGEEVTNTSVAGIPDGTSIEVKHLFFNTPARKKYLKSAQTEYNHILKHMTQMALLHPKVSFTLSHNKKTTLDVRASSIEERMKHMLGHDILTKTTPVYMDKKQIKVSGLLLKPTYCRPARNMQHLFINNRPVRSDIVSKAITEGYHRVIAPGLQPGYVMFLNVPSSEIDVNVHPRKLEVKFQESQSIFSNVKYAVSQALEKQELTPNIQLEQKQNDFSSSFGKKHVNHATTFASSFSPTSKASSPYARPSSSNHAQTALAFSKTLLETDAAPSDNYRYLGQLMNCYLIVETAEGLRLIDQHAAHERVRFERLQRAAQNKDIPKQQLITPELLSLTPIQVSSLIEKQHDLAELGFVIDDIGDGSFALSAIPQDLHSNKHIPDPVHFVEQMLHDDDMLECGCHKSSNELTNYREKLRAFTACRGAIKFGDTLTNHEAEQLLRDFEQCTNKHTCPHGRTSMILIDQHELKKLFDR